MSANTEADTCRVYVAPKLAAAGGELEPHSIAEQRYFIDRRIIVSGGTVRRGKRNVKFDYTTGARVAIEQDASMPKLDALLPCLLNTASRAL